MKETYTIFENSSFLPIDSEKCNPPSDEICNALFKRLDEEAKAGLLALADGSIEDANILNAFVLASHVHNHTFEEVLEHTSISCNPYYLQVIQECEEEMSEIPSAEELNQQFRI